MPVVVWTMLPHRPPKSLRDAHCFGAKKLGHGKGYVYPPNDPAGYEIDYLPDEPKGKTYYEPSGNGEETNPLDPLGVPNER